MVMGFRRQLNSEVHYYDSTDVGYANIGELINTSTATSMVQVAQGQDLTNRIGRSIKVLGIFFRISIIGPVSGTANTARLVRLLIFEDMGNTGTAPTFNDIVLSALGTGSSPANSLKFLNITSTAQAGPRRFNIWMDKHITIPTSGANSKFTRAFEYKKPSLQHKMLWSGTASTDYGQGSLWFIIGCDHATAAEQPTFAYKIRARFIDN